MGIDYLGILKKSLSFSVQPKRWIPLFITDIVLLSMALSFVLSNLENIVFILSNVDTSPIVGLGLFSYLAVLFLIFAIWTLIKLWINGAIIHQSYKGKEFRESWNVSCRRYLSLLGAVISIGVITYLVSFGYLESLIPGISTVGSILSLIVAIGLFFTLQEVIVGKRGFIRALGGSWDIFIRNFRKKLWNWRNASLVVLFSALLSIASTYLIALFTAATGLTLIMAFVSLLIILSIVLGFLVFSRVADIMVLIAIVSMVIIIIFSIPLLIMFLNVFISEVVPAYSMSGTLDASTLASLMLAIQPYTPGIMAAGVVLLVGLAISQVFTLKAQTEFYLKVKRGKRFGIF